MAVAAILINEPWPFEQIFNPLLTEGYMWNLKKIGSWVSEKKSVKAVIGRTTHGKWSWQLIQVS